MTGTAWPPTVAVLVDSVARLLDSNERDAVLGDSLEAGEGPCQALFSILGLVLRRQILVWRSWRPWLAAFGFAVPCTWLLMTVSLSVTCTSERLLGFNLGHWAPTGNEGCALLACHIFLLIAWSWTSGFAIGSLSPRTLWTNAVLFLLLAQYLHHMYIVAAPIPTMHGAVAGGFPFYGSSLTLAPLAPFLFVLPAIWGVRRGMRTVQLRLPSALLLAAAITLLTASAWINNALWVFNWLLLGPAFCLLATARRSRSH
ncbi:MAG TPA: hypothetical protein VGY94_01155 [Acidobacteriaceae bacterium]|jgi:hypothetical protein|nr:hypothetical protein [Acidobacteriaceae bacterium]